jgi:hypothetical protein
MDSSKKASILVAATLILLGGLFLVFNFIPGLTFGILWPIIFIVLAVGFFIPAMVWQEMRSGLAGMFIPGWILLILGCIFFYNTISRDWVSWAYGWILLSSATGIGLYSAAWYGGWDRVTRSVGLWMGVISTGVFAVFAALLGGTLFLKVLGAALLILGGLFFLFRSLRKPPQAE